MKKIIFSALALCIYSLAFSGVSAAWYGNTGIPYTQSSVMTECPDDLDTTGGYGDTVHNKDHAVTDSSTSLIPTPVINSYALNSNQTNAITVAASGTMYCLKWDGKVPTGSVAYSTTTWTNGTVTVSITCSDTGGSACNMYAISGWTISGLVYSRTFSANTSGSIALYDNAGNIKSVTYSIANIDTTIPLVTDINYTCPTNALAISSSGFSIPVSVNGGSPITEITAKFENAADTSLSTVTSTIASSVLTFTRDISIVDGSDRVNGGRNYTFQITHIKDQAGNVLDGSPIKDCSFNVYANSTLINGTAPSKKEVTLSNKTDLEGGTFVANGESKPLVITLKDTYGNQIVPASGISRTIDFNFDATNWLYQDQYNRVTNAVFASDPNATTTYSNYFTTGDSQSKSFGTETSSDGTYLFGFKVYTPTYQNYKADPEGKFIINSINFDINGTLGAVSSQAIANSSNIDFNFKPLYYTTISGDLKEGGIQEGGVQSSTIAVSKNTSSADPSATAKVQLKFGGTTGGMYNFYHSTTDSSNPNNPTTSLTDIMGSVSFPSINNNLYTNLKHIDMAGNTSGAYFSTHISYTLDGYNILYNSDIIGKNNYYDTSANFQTTQQSSIKITGITSSRTNQELTSGQYPADVGILGNTEKFTNKTQFIKNASVFAKNLSATTGNYIASLDGANTDGKEVSNVLYFGGTSGGNVTLGDGGDKSVTGKRTILIIGRNLYIKSNLYYANNSSILGAIVMKDSAGNGGNIYIDPGVTNIVGSLFAERSVISYKDGLELDGNTSVSKLKNQLYIYGNVFSENTLGGSRMSTPKCPYYITSGCTLETAQKYDLNYLRRYYLVDASLYSGTANIKIPFGYSTTKVAGGEICDLNGVCSNTNSNLIQKFTNTNTASDTYAKYPIIIDYNPNLQKNPPPLFTTR